MQNGNSKGCDIALSYLTSHNWKNLHLMFLITRSKKTNAYFQQPKLPLKKLSAFELFAIH